MRCYMLVLQYKRPFHKSKVVRQSLERMIGGNKTKVIFPQFDGSTVKLLLYCADEVMNGFTKLQINKNTWKEEFKSLMVSKNVAHEIS